MNNTNAGFPWFYLTNRRAFGEPVQISMSDNTRNSFLIIGFGLSAALLFYTVYPKR